MFEVKCFQKHFLSWEMDIQRISQFEIKVQSGKNGDNYDDECIEAGAPFDNNRK